MSFGAGATTAVVKPIVCRVFSRVTVGVGAMTLDANPGIRLESRVTSGGGATIESFDRSGAVREDFSPSDGGGPGGALIATRLATAEFETGSFKSGASTTFSTGELPRATRIVWLW